MNKTVENFIRKEIKNGLAQLTAYNHDIFRRMYAPNAVESIAYPEVVNQMESDKLDWALTQVERSIASKENV